MSIVSLLFEELERRPFPVLGKLVGDFLLYESLLAGFASSFLNGKKVQVDEIPEPDAETLKTVEQLRRQQIISSEERAFLEYFDNMDALRNELALMLGSSD